MAYRNGTYIAFHAEGTSDPTASDMRYYQLLKAWTELGDGDFSFINSHDKASSVRDSSKRATLRASLQERLRNSRNMVLIIGQRTRFDTDWVPFEIEAAIDTYGLPIIAAYPDYLNVINPAQLAPLWPQSLAMRISAKSARVIHIPFRKQPMADAIGQFDHTHQPNSPLSYYAFETYRAWGLV